MNSKEIYLDSHILQKDMRIRLPKQVVKNLQAEKGVSEFDIYFNVETKDIVLRINENGRK